MADDVQRLGLHAANQQGGTVFPALVAEVGKDVQAGGVQCGNQAHAQDNHLGIMFQRFQNLVLELLHGTEEEGTFHVENFHTFRDVQLGGGAVSIIFRCV